MTGRLERSTFRAVGTMCEAAVTAGPEDGRLARLALASARAEVAACEAALSRFDASSDLSRLNAAGGAWTAVDRRLVEALRLALRAREDTDGRFDPTVLPALVAAGYDRSFEQLAERPARRAVGWRAGAAIELDESAGSARLEPGAAVDLGGIGKGYAASRALAAMRDAWPMLPGGLVDLGGDLALWGETPERGPWRIAIADPEAVPVGVYSKKWLQSLNLWNEVQPKVVPTLDVRATLAAVESEAAPAGIVYRTDAAISRWVRVAFEVKGGPEIAYSVARVMRSARPEAAAFVEFLASETGKGVFARRGFVVTK